MRYLGGSEEDGRPRGSEYALQSPEGPSERTFCRYGWCERRANAGSTNGHPRLLWDGSDRYWVDHELPESATLGGGRGEGDHLGRLCYVPGRFLWLIGISSGEAITTQPDPSTGSTLR